MREIEQSSGARPIAVRARERLADQHPLQRVGPPLHGEIQRRRALGRFRRHRARAAGLAGFDFLVPIEAVKHNAKQSNLRLVAVVGRAAGPLALPKLALTPGS